MAHRRLQLLVEMRIAQENCCVHYCNKFSLVCAIPSRKFWAQLKIHLVLSGKSQFKIHFYII